MNPILTRRSLEAALLAGATGQAKAQPAFPAKPITLLIPYPPGSGNDLVGRVLGNKLSTLLGQRVVGDNRSGASGNIAIEAVRRAVPDGYTLTVASVSFSMNAAMMAGVNYTVADFTPVAMIGQLPFTLMVQKSVPVTNMRELVNHLKTRPGELYASAGATTFALDAFNLAAGVEVVGIPFRGTTEGVVDLLADRTQMMFAPISTALPPFRNGSVNILGITGAERSPLMPDVPTFKELGFPTLDNSTWFALIGPAGVPAEAVRVVSEATQQALASADVITALGNQGITPGYASPTELAAFLRADLDRWRELVGALGLRPR